MSEYSNQSFTIYSTSSVWRVTNSFLDKNMRMNTSRKTILAIKYSFYLSQFSQDPHFRCWKFQITLILCCYKPDELGLSNWLQLPGSLTLDNGHYQTMTFDWNLIDQKRWQIQEPIFENWTFFIYVENFIKKQLFSTIRVYFRSIECAVDNLDPVEIGIK